jgi:glycosyltransferase involved in cell wall biosynthesis
MKKIVVSINGKFYSQKTTGVQRYAREIVHGLDEVLNDVEYAQRVRLRLIVPHNAIDIPVFKNIEVIRTFVFTNHLWEQFILPLYSFNQYLLSLSGSSPWLKFGQITTIHDAVLYEFPEAYSLKFRIWYRSLFWWQSIWCLRMITISEFSKDRLLKFLPLIKNKLFVAQVGHEHLERISPDTKFLEKINPKEIPYFLIVGSINPNKNLKRLISAVSNYLSKSNHLFMIVGGADLRVFARQEIDNVPNNVMFVGYVGDSELKALYQRAKALVFPSTYEGFGIPLLEAMSVGCPIVASSAASIPEVCGDCATYFDPLKETDIAEKLNNFIAGNGDMSNPGELFNRVKRFSWCESARKILNSIFTAG